MKKLNYFRFYSQLFADDTSNSENQNQPDSNNPENKGNDQGKDDISSKDQKKYTDADVDKILNQKFAKWQKDQELKVSEAKKLAEMSATQKAEYERDKYQKELETLQKEVNRSKMLGTARQILSESGLNVSDDLIGMIITDEADGTKKNIESFKTLFQAAVDSAVKDALKHKGPAAAGSGSTITKEQIMKIANTAERQKAIREHMDLFK